MRSVLLFRISPAIGITVLLIATYLVVVAFHVVVLAPYFDVGIGAYYVPDGGRIIGSFIGDEAMYRLYSESILHLEKYPAHAIYPPGYPLLLAVAQAISPAEPIRAMVSANIAMSSAVLFPVYALARTMLGRGWSLAAGLVAGLLPASFIFAPALMSENLFTTLFATAFWLAIRPHRAGPRGAWLFGICLAACFLTKFIFLAIAPILCVAFAVNQWLHLKASKNLSLRSILQLAGAATLGGVLLVVPWSAYVLYSEGTIAESLGMHIATLGLGPSTGPDLALAYPIFGLQFVALAASALPFIAAAGVGLLGSDANLPKMHLLALGATSAVLLLFVTVYGLGASTAFGYPQPILQRYLMMLVPLFVPLAFMGIAAVRNGANWQRLFLTAIALFVLALFVQAGLYDRTIWPVPSWTTVVWVAGPDVLYGALGFPIIVVVLATVAALFVTSVAGKVATAIGLHARWVTGFAGILLTVGFVIFNVANGLAGSKFAWDDPFLALNTAHARAITKIIGDRRANPCPAVVHFAPEVLASIEIVTERRILSEGRWSVNMLFWSGRDIAVVGEGHDAQTRPDYWVFPETATRAVTPTNVYTVRGRAFQVATFPPIKP